MIDLDKLRALCASIAERNSPDGHPDVQTLLCAMSDVLYEAGRLQAELKAMRYDRDWVVAEADDDVRARYFALKAAEEARRG